MERETAKLQELRSAPSVFDFIICGIFSHTVGLQLLTWTARLPLTTLLPTLLSFRYGVAAMTFSILTPSTSSNYSSSAFQD
jgi:hypothetical protein